MEMIALQAVKCMAVLRTLCGHRATRLLNPVGEPDSWGGEHTDTRLACKYNSSLSLGLQQQLSTIGFSFSDSYLLPVAWQVLIYPSSVAALK